MEEKRILTSVTGYIELQPTDRREGLECIRHTIIEAVPEAEEKISYQMPSYRLNGMLCWFAAAKNHYGLYFRPHILEAFKNKLSEYELTKSAIHLPIGKPIPEKLIAEMAKYAAADNLKNKHLKDIQKNKK